MIATGNPLRFGNRRRSLPLPGWQAIALLYLACITCACGHPQETPAPAENQAVAAAAPVAPTAPAAPPASTPPATAGIRMDLSYVDRKSAAFQRFRSFVDSAVGGNPGYAFSASDAALMYRISGGDKYCELAVATVEKQVADAEQAIAGGGRPAVAGDSYLEVGQMISDLALTLDTCTAVISTAQRTRWSAYAEQAVWNVWNHAQAKWGGNPHPWTGWSTDNPGNNYYYSFLEATMYWALASGSQKWMDELRTRRLPPLREYFSRLKGGGSSEGTGYGTAHMRLFSVYLFWRDATGEDLANANPHASDSIAYWVHATVPTLDRFAPIGDQSRNSVPELYDYHRRLVLEARQLSKDEVLRGNASWWLNHISVPQMSAGFNSRYDLYPAGDAGAPPQALVYHAEGTGHLFARSGWEKDAMWLSFVAGAYNESHAHQDQGSFTLFARDWLAVTENIWSHSGIQQGTEVHNVVRFERANAEARQCNAPANDRIVHQCEPTRSKMTVGAVAADGSFTIDADLSPAYRDNPALKSWQRQLRFGGRKLVVQDRFQPGTGTRAIFQLNVPEKPQVNGNEAIAGRLRIRVLEPANATIAVHDWSSVDAQEFRRGWRVDIGGGESGYLVELSEK